MPDGRSLSLMGPGEPIDTDPPGDDILVFVKTLTEETITIWVCLDDAISVVREKIKARGLSVEASIGTFRIVFGGKQLKDGRKLRDYGVQRGSTLVLLVGLMGGGAVSNLYCVCARVGVVV